jgi:hypothetical protein
VMSSARAAVEAIAAKAATARRVLEFMVNLSVNGLQSFFGIRRLLESIDINRDFTVGSAL